VYGIGRDLPYRRDLGRYVKWPRYVRIQRQKAVLTARLKVPPAINQFANTISKDEATRLFELLTKYRPEDAAAKKQRLQAKAAAQSDNKETDSGSKPKVVKFGLKHITNLIEQKIATLVCIANDVDPLELVVWLPALCRKFDVPYVIVKNKARLGALVHQKMCAVVALTEVNKEDLNTLKQLQNNALVAYNNNVDSRKKWGGGALGIKSQHAQKKRLAKSK
jgi:large subunit ribosomal protein L7Ae